jgi:hypothetical protein
MDTKNVKGKGLFIESLNRNNSQIKEDRATAILEDTQLKYKRKVEDLGIDIRNLERKREAMLDLSPSDANSLTLSKDFDAENYVNSDLEIATKIETKKMVLKVAKERYQELFGEEINI